MHIYPLEIIYSAIARLHLREGHQSSAQTNKLLFKKDKKRLHPYLPSGLNHLSDFIGVDTNTLLHEHTFFNLYQYCLSKEKTYALEHAMLGTSACVPTSVIDANSNIPFRCALKCCPLCAQHDIEKTGVSYWHLYHQLPGIDVCTIHNCMLHSIEVGDKALAHQYLQPISGNTLTNKNNESLKFAIFCETFLKIIDAKGALPVSDLYQGLLKEHRFIKGTKSLDHERIERYLFSSQKNALEITHAYVSLKQMYRILSAPRRDLHPMKHMCLLYLLSNGSPISIEKIRSISEVESPKLHDENQYIALENKIIVLFRKGVTINSIANRFNISRVTTKRVLKQNGCIPLSPLEYKVCSLGEDGHHRSDIAQRMNISIGYVEQLLSMKKGLVKRRKMLAQSKKEQRYKDKILQYRKAHPDRIRRDIRAHLYKEYDWLYQHDTVWLEAHLPSPSKPRPSGRKRSI